MKVGFNIVMYHYVRDILSSRYPKLHALDEKAFEFQLLYLKSNYKILNPNDIIDIVISRKTLPKNGCWLTFDDGYMDHYENVFPLLEKHKLKGSFFPTVKTTLHSDVLNANKVHFIIASKDDISSLLEQLRNLYYYYETDKLTNRSFTSICKTINTSHRYDDQQTVIFKRLLQTILPDPVRQIICDELFSQIVSSDFSDFSSKLYMGLPELLELKSAGHNIGLHGYDHSWLGKMTHKTQKLDISSSLSFFKTNKLCEENWIMSYPHGDYNNYTVDIVKELGGVIGLTTEPVLTNLINYNPLLLPRMNTNDYPQS